MHVNILICCMLLLWLLQCVECGNPLLANFSNQIFILSSDEINVLYTTGVIKEFGHLSI